MQHLLNHSKSTPDEAVTTSSVLLSITTDRLQFWQGQLQTAFRDGSEERAAICGHIIAEYQLLISELMKQLRMADSAGE